MSNLLKNLLIALGLAVLLFVGYMLFIRSSGDEYLVSDTQSSASLQAEFETQQLLTLLNELHTLNVKGDIFSDPLFLSLKDFRNDLGEEMTGRSNPFAPVE